MTHLLPVYNWSDLCFTRGEGVFCYTADGTRYLDFAGGIAVLSLGHCHPHIVKALQEQAAKIWHTSNMYHIDGAEKLSTRLTKASGFADYVFFTNSGTEAMECGIKMVRAYHHNRGNPEKIRILTFENSFHGRTMAAISASGKDKVLKGFTPALPGFDCGTKFNDIDAVKARITPETGAILLEPVQGEGGISVATDSFLQDLRQLCDEHGMLLYFDGIQCGMGRTGKFFSHEWSGITPDIVASAKGIGGGFPLGACLATQEAASGLKPGMHGTTYGGNPLAMAVGNAVMDILLAEGFFERVVEMGTYLKSYLESIAADYPDVIAEIRGKGLMLGIKFRDEYPCMDVVKTLRTQKLLTAFAGDNVVRLLPPLTITQSEVNLGLDILKQYCKELSLTN